MQEALKLLSDLGDDDIRWILDTGHEEEVAADTVLITEGTDPDNLYILLSGVVDIRVSGIGATPLAKLGPGELLGEMSFLDGAPASANVVAGEPSLVLALPRQALQARLGGDAAFSARFYKALALLTSRRLRDSMGTFGRWLRPPIEGGDEGKSELWSTLSGALDRFKELLHTAAGQESTAADQDPPADVARHAREEFSRLLVALNESVGDGAAAAREWREEMGLRLQRECLPFVLLSRFAERCYRKPRGYAGDYLTIEWMYRNTPGGHGAIGRLIDGAILDAPPCRAVRNRRGLLTQEMLDAIERKGSAPLHVVSMACGPAEELFDVLARLDDCGRLQATLIDIDREALGHVADRIEREQLGEQVTLEHANLVYLATGQQQLGLANQDLVYSIGLIDYFEDRYVVALLNYAYEVLAEGGKVILGNFHPRNAAKAFMDYVLDWKLIHRTEEDMNRLYEMSRFGRPCTRIQYEAEGINLFAECEKV
ncbi:MAG: cyclic nucleotide-binding domain-containing protein [Vicinamibacterales bacterium]|jgi:CRP-like cAMP-binding protein|nr:cyclic nucleotide-binding domain-containing protein [Vicinamibacterales bacterium]